MKYRIFAYGTLKNSTIRKSILSRDVEYEKDTLTGFRIGQILLDGILYPAAFQDPFCRIKIRGISFTVTPPEIELIDDYESEAYRRIPVKLMSGKDAWLYIKA